MAESRRENHALLQQLTTVICARLQTVSVTMYELLAFVQCAGSRQPPIYYGVRPDCSTAVNLSIFDHAVITGRIWQCWMAIKLSNDPLHLCDTPALRLPRGFGDEFSY